MVRQWGIKIMSSINEISGIEADVICECLRSISEAVLYMLENHRSPTRVNVIIKSIRKSSCLTW